ncbi:hypothetical protein P692DRAFT_2067802 [Suillus brevipes Sb2]|nr:hypothetical protein P692DRAFT_2067802 [Suillus brevipes Sb2]
MEEVESWDVSRETNGIILGVIPAGGVGGKFTAMGVSWPMFSAASGGTSVPSVSCLKIPMTPAVFVNADRSAPT